jgi:hypothetical protein
VVSRLARALPFVCLVVALAPGTASAQTASTRRWDIAAVGDVGGSTAELGQIAGSLSLEGQYRFTPTAQHSYTVPFGVNGTLLSGQTIISAYGGIGFVLGMSAPGAGPSVWQPLLALHVVLGPFAHEIRSEATRWSWGLLAQPTLDILWSGNDAIFGGARVGYTLYFEFDRARDPLTVVPFGGVFFGARL